MNSVRATSKSKRSKKYFLPGFLLLMLILSATAPFYVQPYFVIFLTSLFMYIALTASWAIFSGPTRHISLASAAFFGIGIYISAILGKLIPLPFVFLAGALASFILALFIGLLTLRLRGMYFIIFTFGASELIRHFLEWWEVNKTGTVGRWVVSVDHTTVYYAMLFTLLTTLGVAIVIRRSKYGLALRSIGLSEEAAAHIGINVNVLKIITFAISAFFMGATGAIMATRWTYIDPSMAFNPLFSFMPVLMAIFGGIGQIYGHVLGATFFAVLEEVLITQFPYYYMLIFGLILIGVILFLPQGMTGLQVKIMRRRKGGIVN